MQKIQHQINASEALNYQINKLDDELKYEEYTILNEIESLKKELRALKGESFGKGNFTFFRLLVRFCIMLAFLGWGYFDQFIDPTGGTSYIGLYFTAGIVFIFVLISFFKYGKLKRAKDELTNRIHTIERKIEGLYKSLSQLPEKYQKMKQEEIANIEKVMVDQKQLQAMEQIQLDSGMKECPKCAEMIRAKATFCRFCESELA
jgi:hypothetical protein